MKDERKKLIYILPKYDTATDTHFSYLYPFLNKISDSLNLFVVIEKVGMGADGQMPYKKRIIRSKSVFFRMIEELFIIFFAHMRGYRDVYVHYSFTGALASLIVTKAFGGRVFYWNCGMPWLYKMSAFREKVFRYILRNAILVTGSQSLRDEYALQYDLDTKKSRILHNWVDTKHIVQVDKVVARKQLGIKEDKKIVLFVHHLSKRKGADKIIQTAEQLKDNDTIFLVVGDGPDKNKLEREVSEKSMQGVVKIIGKVPQRDINLYFGASDVFFMPSEEEGFPHVLLEALAYGVSYVASDVGGVRDISPDIQKSFIITERKPELFAQKIQTLLERPLDSKMLQEHVKRFDTSVAVKIFKSFLSKKDI